MIETETVLFQIGSPNRYHPVVRMKENSNWNISRSRIWGVALHLLMAAFISETILAGGLIRLRTAYHRDFMRLAANYDSLLIVDERKTMFINIQRILRGDNSKGFNIHRTSFKCRPCREQPSTRGILDSAWPKRVWTIWFGIRHPWSTANYKTFFLFAHHRFLSDRFRCRPTGGYWHRNQNKRTREVHCRWHGNLASWTQDSGYVIELQTSGQPDLGSISTMPNFIRKWVLLNAGEILSSCWQHGRWPTGPAPSFWIRYNGNAINLKSL